MRNKNIISRKISKKIFSFVYFLLFFLSLFSYGKAMEQRDKSKKIKRYSTVATNYGTQPVYITTDVDYDATTRTN